LTIDDNFDDKTGSEHSGPGVCAAL
jgi:hypothetical protein